MQRRCFLTSTVNSTTSTPVQHQVGPLVIVRGSTPFVWTIKVAGAMLLWAPSG